MIGQYKDDVQGFIEEVKEIMENATYEVGAVIDDGKSPMEKALDDLYEDRERFRNEIAEQLRQKVNAHMYGKERTMSDFVKPKYNEQSAYANYGAHLDSSVERLERNIGQSEAQEGEENFDREAFDKLKDELRQKKKLKEDMLTGTMPRFKPYLRV